METSIPTLAGIVSTVLYAVGTLPMLLKAFRTKDLASYSLGNMLLSSAGNLVNSIYIFHLPSGPIWFLHTYNLVTTGLMLVWYLRYELLPKKLQSTNRHLATWRLPHLCCSTTM